MDNAQRLMGTIEHGKIEKGIRKERGGYVAYTRVQGTLHRKWFRGDATLLEMRGWRLRQKKDRRWTHIERVRNIPKMQRNVNGWCYLYAVRAGEFVKFGRAVDPVDRLEELQSGHPERLLLLAAVPIHANFERVVHEHFRDKSAGGEWFRLDKDLEEFIARLKNGENPVAVLWNSLV
jgi:hypothetical protein